MKKLLFLSFLFCLFACSTDNLVNNYANDNDIKNLSNTRSLSDVKNIINDLYPATRASNSLKINVFTSNDFLNEEEALQTRSAKENSNDTLLYSVEGIDNPVIISGNKNCEPLIAILDNPDFSLKDIIANPTPENEGVLMFIENAIIYNEKPNVFEKELSVRASSGLSIVEEVLPKVPVEWRQKKPFNKYTPNNYPAGCVAVATAQAFMVTRHVGTFNGIHLNYDDLIKVKNGSYESLYPNETNKIAFLMREIGNAVGMKYGKKGSSASTSDAIKLFTFGGFMNLSKDKRDIRRTLKNYDNGIVIISSRTKKSFLGISRGSGHSYIADGYKIFSDGSDLIHVNYGWGPFFNGYFLTKLHSPYFIPEAENQYPHKWRFYCLYK